MKDFYIKSNGEFDFTIESDSTALRSRIATFLSVSNDELSYDVKQGLDLDFLRDNSYNNAIKKDYIKNQLLKYYEEIKEILSIEITIDKKNRNMIIDFNYVDVFGVTSNVKGGY